MKPTDAFSFAGDPRIYDGTSGQELPPEFSGTVRVYFKDGSDRRFKTWRDEQGERHWQALRKGEAR